MNDIDILKQLLNGNHLNENELKKADRILKFLIIALNSRLKNDN